jgi:hypothetical protein
MNPAGFEASAPGSFATPLDTQRRGRGTHRRQRVNRIQLGQIFGPLAATSLFPARSIVRCRSRISGSMCCSIQSRQSRTSSRGKSVGLDALTNEPSHPKHLFFLWGGSASDNEQSARQSQRTSWNLMSAVRTNSPKRSLNCARDVSAPTDPRRRSSTGQSACQRA